MPINNPPQVIINHLTDPVHEHITDGSSGTLIDYGSFTVKQNGVEYTFDENDGINQYDSFYVYVWHMDVHRSGYAWIRFYYGDDDYDEFMHKGNGSRSFYLREELSWSNYLGIGDASEYLPRMGITRNYDFRGIREAGTSTWEFVNREPGLTKIAFMHSSNWEGMRGIFILKHENLETRPPDEEKKKYILQEPSQLNQYLYLQSSEIRDHTNKIPRWSPVVQQTKTSVGDTWNTFGDGGFSMPSDYFTYFYDGYISFPVNTTKHFGLASDDDSFMWIVEGDRLWSTVASTESELNAFDLTTHIQNTGNNVVLEINDQDNHPFPHFFQGHRIGSFTFQANKLYTILIKITEHNGDQGLYFGINDSSLDNVYRRNDTFPEYFGTNYTLIIINDPPIVNPPHPLEIDFHDHDIPFDIDISSHFTDPDGDDLTYSIEYISNNYFTATIENAKIHIIPNINTVTSTVFSQITLTATDTFGNSEQSIIYIAVRGDNDPPAFIGENILTYDEDSQDIEINLKPMFTDPEAGSLSFQVTPLSSEIIKTYLNDDILKLNFIDNKNGDTYLNITATDAGNKFHTATILVRVNPVNDKPYALGYSETASEVHININEQEDFKREYVINLDSFIKDREDDSLEYIISIPSINEQLFSGRIEEIEDTNYLKLEFVENAHGYGEIEVTATDRDPSNPLSLKVKWIVNIEGVDDDPYVNNKLDNIVRQEDALRSEEIDVSNVFADIESNDLSLSVIDNTNPSLVIATLQGNKLQLEYLEHQHGTCTITLKAEQINNPDKFVTDQFTITVTAFDDDPYVNNKLDNIVRQEDAIRSEEIDVSNVFADIESNDLRLSIIRNTNTSLVIATLQDNQLNLEYLEHQHGICSITLKAEQVNNPDKYVTDQFTITVTAFDDAPYVNNKLDNIVRVEDAIRSEEIDVSNVFADIESNDLSLSVIDNTNTSLVTVSLQVNQLHLDYLEHQHGVCTITLKAEQVNNPDKYVIDQFTITVLAFDDAPYVANTIQDKNRDEDALRSEEIDVSNVFADIESNDLSLSVIDNTNPSLVIATLQGNKLQLEYLEHQHGTCTITLKAEQINNPDKFVTDQFTITVFPFDDDPYVNNKLDNIVRQEDAIRSEEIDVSNVFADIESNDLRLSVIGNTNTSLVTATLQDNQLQLDYLEHQHGTCTITLKAEQVNNTNKYVTDSFDIIVNPVPDAPVAVDNPPNETITVNEDYNKERIVVVSNKFFDADGDTLRYTIDNTNDNVSTASLDPDSGTVTITFKMNANTTQHGEAKVIVTATDNTDTSATYTINLIVNPINDRPHIILNIEDIEVNEDSIIPVFNLNNYFGDIENDNLDYQVTTSNSNVVVPFLNNSELTLDLLKNKHTLEEEDGIYIHKPVNITVNIADREPNDAERHLIVEVFRIRVNPVNDAAKSFQYYLYSHISFPIYGGEKIMEFTNIEDDDEIELHREYSFAIMENEPQGYLSRLCMIDGNYLKVKQDKIIYNLPQSNILYIEIRDGDLTIPYHGPDNPIIIHRYDFSRIPSATGAPLSIIPKNLIL